MVGLLAVTGGALATGFGVYTYLTKRAGTSRKKFARGRKQPESADFVQNAQPESAAQLQPHAASHEMNLAPNMPSARGVPDELRYGLHTSSISLALATTGLLVFDPLRYASVATLLYMGIPPAQDAYVQLKEESRASLALVETVALAVCLASGYYWVGSLGFWAYYLGRTLVHNRSLDSQQELNESGGEQWPAPHMACLLHQEGEIEVPTASLQRGDRIIVRTSGRVPVDGRIFEGSAWIRPGALGDQTAETYKSNGDSVSATDLVLIGRICVLVQRMA
jgi:cation transport ATPase